MEAWKKVLREGLFPLMSTEHLEILLSGLEKDDPRLMQGATTSPPPMQCVLDWPCESGCLIAYPFAFEEKEPRTVGETEEFFARICFKADQILGEPAAIRYLLNWYDDTPRDEMRKLLVKEISEELERRTPVEILSVISYHQPWHN